MNYLDSKILQNKSFFKPRRQLSRPSCKCLTVMQWAREAHLIHKGNTLSSLHDTTCLIFKFLFVTNFYFYFHFFSPWRRFVFKPKYWAICLTISCFVLSFCLLLHRLSVMISLPFYIFRHVIVLMLRWKLRNSSVLYHKTKNPFESKICLKISF